MLVPLVASLLPTLPWSGRCTHCIFRACGEEGKGKWPWIAIPRDWKEAPFYPLSHWPLGTGQLTTVIQGAGRKKKSLPSGLTKENPAKWQLSNY